MLLTEEEAKTKWCPHAKPVVIEFAEAIILPEGRSLEVNEEGKPIAANQNCVGSACMAWRWHPKDGGYCGLSGKPE